jgi:hypothetical protein
MGANPAEVRSGPLKGLRALGREQDLGHALARGMDAAQRRRMIQLVEEYARNMRPEVADAELRRVREAHHTLTR